MRPSTLTFMIICFAAMMALLVSCSGEHSSPGPPAARDDSLKSADSAESEPQSVLTYEQRQGKNLYAKYCAICHGGEGQGDGFNAFNLDPKPRDFTDARYMNALTDERISQTIAGGGRSVNKSVLMQSWSGRLKKEEISYVLSYIRTFPHSR